MQSQFASLRAQAERYYSKYNTFGINTEGLDLCSYNKSYGFGGVAGPGMLKDIADSASISLLNTNLGTKGAWNQVTCHATNDYWAVEAPLSDSKDPAKGGNASMYCIDSKEGKIVQQSTNLRAGSYSCIGN